MATTDDSQSPANVSNSTRHGYIPGVEVQLVARGLRVETFSSVDVNVTSLDLENVIISGTATSCASFRDVATCSGSELIRKGRYKPHT